MLSAAECGRGNGRKEQRDESREDKEMPRGVEGAVGALRKRRVNVSVKHTFPGRPGLSCEAFPSSSGLAPRSSSSNACGP